MKSVAVMLLTAAVFPVWAGVKEDAWVEATVRGGGQQEWRPPEVFMAGEQLTNADGQRVYAIAKFWQETDETGHMGLRERIFVYVGLGETDFKRHLVHEMLHCVWARRAWTDDGFRRRYPDSEAFVLERLEGKYDAPS